jgi:solute:Na+ symporter, SSS family
MTMPFGWADWIVMAVYVVLLFAGGWFFTPRHTETAKDYFLAGNTVPAWLAGVSVLSATQSAATFLGGPDYGYRGNYTYLSTNIGALIGAVFVAQVLIPRYYAMNATTAYEILTKRFSVRATQWAGGTFLIGRVLAGGARVYLAAIAIAMVTTSQVDAASVMTAAAALMIASFLFSFHGGLKSVLWNDLMQFVIYLVAAIAILVFLRYSIPASTGEIVRALSHTPDGIDKLQLFDFSLDPSKPFTMVAIVTGVALLYIGNSGLDQDTTQRLLASPDAKTGARGLYFSVFAAVPVVFIFVTIGLLLYVRYNRPDLMGGPVPAVAGEFAGQKINIFMHYILTEVPQGLRGLVTIGVIAAAVATTNSALNAMSSVLIQDFYRNWRIKRGGASEKHFVVAGRWGMAIVGAAMFIMAVVSYYWQQYANLPLIEFALGVMVFAYAGLLGVYFIAVFTTRGSTSSVIAALIAGFFTVVLVQPAVARALALPEVLTMLSFPYQLCIGTLVSLIVCGAVPKQRVEAVIVSAGV